MRWEDERYVRLYTRESADWLDLTWEARALFHELLKKADRAGLIPLGKSGARGLSRLVHMPEDVVTAAIKSLIADECVIDTEDGLLLPGFLKAQECAKSDAARKREQREREREDAIAKSRKDYDVTSGHDASQNVTPIPNLPTLPTLPEPPPGGADAPTPGSGLEAREPPGSPLAAPDVSGPPATSPEPPKRHDGPKATPAGAQPELFVLKPTKAPKLKSPKPRTAVDVLTAEAWPIWRSTYAESRRGYGKYIEGPRDNPALRQLAETALTNIENHGRIAADAANLLAHWFASYLEDDGRQGFRLTDKRHALQHLAHNPTQYGAPWDGPTRPGATRGANPDDIMTNMNRRYE